MAINIGSLTHERRNGYAALAYEEGERVREERICISFLKPTSKVWRDVQAIEKDTDKEKDLLVLQLVRLDVQSNDIEDSPGNPHKITQQDLEGMDILQLRQLMDGVKESFFLQAPSTESETSTNSTS